MILNLNIRHTYLNIKINNQGKTLHAWSLTTESNKGRHLYTENSNLSFSSKNDTFRIWRSLWSGNLNIRHTYLNIKINNQRKTLHAWSLTTESNKGSFHNYWKFKLKVFLPKMILLESGDHCDLKVKY